MRGKGELKIWSKGEKGVKRRREDKDVEKEKNYKLVKKRELTGLQPAFPPQQNDQKDKQFGNSTKIANRYTNVFQN